MEILTVNPREKACNDEGKLLWVMSFLQGEARQRRSFRGQKVPSFCLKSERGTLPVDTGLAMTLTKKSTGGI